MQVQVSQPFLLQPSYPPTASSGAVRDEICVISYVEPPPVPPAPPGISYPTTLMEDPLLHLLSLIKAVHSFYRCAALFLTFFGWFPVVIAQ